MIVHAIDAHFSAQRSAYEMAYSGPQQPAAAPPVRIASNAPVPVSAPPALRPGILSRNEAPCSIQRGYADANGWGGVIAECDGNIVSVGGEVALAPAAATGEVRDDARRVLLGSLEPDVPGANRMMLPSVLMLMLAALALYFVARSFREEPYRD